MEAIAALSQVRPAAPLQLPARFGRYRLIRLLAVGGMAQIYLAKAFGAEGFVKKLVIKRLDPNLAKNPHFTSLFINEAKLLVTLNHGNIVPVFDFGRVDEDLFMAMEYIAGASLRNLVQALRQDSRFLDRQLAAHIATEVCKGLDYAHRKNDELGRPAGIIHRDIKPTNILISLEGEVKIVDFGVAKLAGRMETGGMLTGTLAYMSPEQAERQAVDPRTDIFSTGLVLYEMLTGQRAYVCETALDMLALARKADLPPLSDDVPAELRAIVEKSTCRDPSGRYASAHEMEQALSEYLLLARSAGSTVDSVSPASKLSALMKELPQTILGPAAELEDDSDEDLELELVLEPPEEEVSGLQDGSMLVPVDLNLIRDAAETFHSEFMTRVLMEEDERPPPRRWVWLAVGAAVGLTAVAVAVAVVLVLRARPHPPPTPIVSLELDWGVAVSLPDDAAPLDAAVATGTDAGAPVEDAAGGMDSAPPADSGRRRPGRRHRFGYLNINSIPWSNVTIDGRRQKRPTPLLRIRLRAGRHTVVLENREQSLRKTLKVWVRGGTTTWKVVKLR